MSELAVASELDSQATADQLQIAELHLGDDDHWPQRRVLTVTAQGCAWRCTYCYVPGLQSTATEGAFTWADALSLLAADREGSGPADAIVFTGGEPTRQEALLDAMSQARERGLSVGLHTSGAYPDRLRRALAAVDKLVLDIKAMPEGYQDITGKPASGAKAWESLGIAIEWGGDLEVRMTVDPTTHSKESVLAVVRRVVAMGGPEPVLQEAHSEGASPEFVQALAGRGIADVLSEVEGLQIRF